MEFVLAFATGVAAFGLSVAIKHIVGARRRRNARPGYIDLRP